MRSVRLTDWSKKSPAEREKILRDMVQATTLPPNGQPSELDAEIRGFEAKLGMDSHTMRARFAAGEIEETLDICMWLMALKLRDEIASIAARSD